MKLCIPVTEDKGIKSPVCGHFGSAALFMVVETDTGSCRAIPNRNLHHQHGMCMPLASLEGEDIDGIIAGGIGMGALMKIQAAGLKVFIAEQPTVEEAVASYKAGTLAEATPGNACHGHGPHGHGPCG